jgi:flagellar motor protein MotB
MTETPVPPIQPEPGSEELPLPGAGDLPSTGVQPATPVQPSIRTVEGLQHLTFQFLLAEATELAATGHYAEAEARLAAIPDGRKHPPVLDLLARIRAQQGRPAESVEFWQMAVQMDPANAEYRAGLAYVEKAARGPFHPSRLPGLLLRLLAGLLVLVLFIAVLVRLGGLERRLSAFAVSTPAPGASHPVDLSGIENQLQSLETGMVEIESSLVDAQTDLSGVQTRLEEWQSSSVTAQQLLEGQLAALDSGQQALLASQTMEADPIDLKLEIPGLNLAQEGENWIITPESGLFRYGWLLSDEAQPLLEQLAWQLAPWAGQTQLELVGYAAEDEQDPNFNLAMIRAVLVSDVLSAAGLPEEMIRIRPAAGRPVPFDNASLSGRAANRTVIFILHRWPQ